MAFAFSCVSTFACQLSASFLFPSGLRRGMTCLRITPMYDPGQRP